MDLRPLAASVGWLALILFGTVRVAVADDFRIETRVVVGDAADRPISRSVTIFHEGRVYDFLEGEASEIAVFDVALNQFALLDTERRLQTLLSGDDLLPFTSALQVQARESSPLHQFLADPQFEETYDREEGRLVLSSQYLTYRVTASTDSDHRQAVFQYSQFADWYARLNATERGGAMPFARLALNRALVQHEILPLEVQLLRTPPNGKLVLLTSHHTIRWELSPEDYRRIDQVTAAAKAYEIVDFIRYRALGRSDRTARRED